MITAYAQACKPDAVQIWVGLYGHANPPPATLSVAGQSVSAGFTPIHDETRAPDGAPLNHRAVLRVEGLAPDTPCRAVVDAGGERAVVQTRTLPAQLPAALDDSFNILLFSCYFQPEDASGQVDTVVGSLPLPIHLTLLMGDQIYGDLPLFHDFPADAVAAARLLGAKYRANWASVQLGPGGIGRVLARAPVLCVADDHEYWNNYPFSQAQLPVTWTPEGRQAWAGAARALYEDYQLGALPARYAQRLDIGPLKMLALDMRSFREDNLSTLVGAEGVNALRTWAADLESARQVGAAAFGLLCSGQALLVEKKNEWRRYLADAEMANYRQFDNLIFPVLDDLAAKGIPVIYVTGDVHWGRVAQAVDVRSQVPMLYEVITSPACLVRTPMVDRMKEIGASLANVLGAADDWPRHSPAEAVPDRFGTLPHFRPVCDVKSGSGAMQRGDQVAVLSLCAAGPRLDFKVTYYPVTKDPRLAIPKATRSYQMRND